MSKDLNRIIDFFDTIGLPYKLTKVRNDSFMRGIDIQSGVLLIDTDTLPYVGDALHEAGHIAVTEENLRPNLQGNVAECGHGPGHEMAAIAWSWAALKHIGLNPEIVFHQDGYKEESATIISAFEGGRGFGTPLLALWNMCHPYGHANEFPAMLRWLRPAQAGTL